MLNLKMVVLAAVVAVSGMAVETSAIVLAPPGWACTAANEGETAFTQSGRRLRQWECYNNQWLLMVEYQCDQYGNNCIPL